MTINQIKEILNGTFSDENDRIYWSKKLEELETKEENENENKKYFTKNCKYDR